MKDSMLVRAIVLCGAALLAGCNTLDELREKPPEPQPVAPELPSPLQGAIGTPGGGLSLFEDAKARNVGDLLTVQLVESTVAKKSASTSTSKDDSVTLGDVSAFGYSVKTGAGVSGKRAFAGTGDSEQSNQLSGNLTVTVVQRLGNGNLVVRGEKQLRLNQGSEIVRIEGVVRPVDIGTDNTISSSRVANARVVYAGKGALADANAQGWLTRFFNSSWMPF